MSSLIASLEILTRLIDTAERLIGTDAPIAARFVAAASSVNRAILAAQSAGRDLTDAELAGFDEAERLAVAGWDEKG